MSYPENPETIVLKNKFYPKGFREIDLWNYYQKVKVSLIKETIGRDLMFIILADLNKPIIRKKLKSGPIKLTPDNYDTIISGRTLSIHSTMSNYESIVIIDVDIQPNENIKWAIDATKNTYNFVMDKIPIIRKATIRYTGKTSFHIVCVLGRKIKIDASKFIIEKFLRESPLSRVYTINERKARSGVPNLDLNRNCYNCNFITLNSLSLFGLRCMEIPYNNLTSFNIINAKI